MKKINTNRLIALLAALCLVTSCFVGSTLAKYVTDATGTSSARVAKFGLTVTVNGDAFSKTYASETSGYTENTVVSEVEVVAPGTTGIITKGDITGKAEVAVAVTNAAVVTFNDKWTASSDYYCPLKVTVGNTTLNGLDYNSTTEFAEDIQEAVADVKANFDAGFDFDETENETEMKAALPDVSWSWDYTASGNQTDAKDTILGNAADAKVSIAITTTVTQID